MKLELLRFPTKEDSTRGKMLVNGRKFCDTLEDEKRSVKVKGETRIPAGKYQIKKREVLSGLTKTYRSKFDWFDFHLELQDVPNFRYVYIHVGNYDDDTDGCILLGLGFTDYEDESAIWNSRKAFKEFYETVSDALDEGEEVWLTIYDHTDDL